MFRILESFLLLVFGIGILCEQYTQYRNNVSKKEFILVYNSNYIDDLCCDCGSMTKKLFVIHVSNG